MDKCITSWKPVLLVTDLFATCDSHTDSNGLGQKISTFSSMHKAVSPQVNKCQDNYVGDLQSKLTVL